MAAKIDCFEGDALIKQLLVGAAFVGFKFGSNFSLFFDRQHQASYKGKPLPWQIRVDLLEDWWLGEELSWEEDVLHRGSGIEPDEPVKAFELAKLRWSDGATVSFAKADEERLVIGFENGIVLNARLTSEDEYSYAICSCDSSADDLWTVTLDSTGIHLQMPN